MYWGVGESFPSAVAVSSSESRRVWTVGWVRMSRIRAWKAVPVVSAPARRTSRISARM